MNGKILALAICAGVILQSQAAWGQTSSALANSTIVAFVSTTNADKARVFYRDKLGLKLIAEGTFALQFEGHGTTLRVTIAPEVKPHAYTVLGWSVPDLKAAVSSLQKQGIVFERFGFMKQDELGIAMIGVDQVAWFKDPDGNLLSLDHHGK